MAREATGTIRFKRGRYLAALRGEYLGSYKTKQEAQDRIDAALRIDSGKSPDIVSVLGQQWLNEREKAGDVRDIQNERGIWRTHIATAKFAGWPAKRVHPSDVQAWLVVMSKKNKLKLKRRKVDGKWVSELVETDKRVSKQVVIHARRVLLAFYTWACLERKVTSNPVSITTVPRMARVREEEEEWCFLKPEEITRLFERIEKAKRKDFYRAFYAVAIYGGLREGEICGLRWKDVRSDHLQVRMNFTKPLKAEASNGSVPMLRPLREALATWRRASGAVQLTGLVFPSQHGGCYSKGYDAGWDTQWRKKAGCPAHVRFHDLRHTCASHLVMGTFGRLFARAEVTKWLRHGDAKTTERYMHLAPGGLARTVREMESE